MAVTRLLADGRCVVTPDDLADVGNVSISTARSFLAGATTVGMAQRLSQRIPVATALKYVITEHFPGAPSAETVTMSALLEVASGPETSSPRAAFAYHSALMLHGLTEVAPQSLHVIKIRPSIHPPALDPDKEYAQSVRPPKEWMRLASRQPVYLTLRSLDQVPATDLVRVSRENMPLWVTSPMRTLTDAWMHPDWCGGLDRVLDSWSMFWSSLGAESSGVSVTWGVQLVQTTWPGLWRPLTRWAASLVPSLKEWPELVEKLAVRRP